MRLSELYTVFLPCVLLKLTDADSAFPSYDVTCSRDEECPAPGTRCYKDYVGCDVGTCGCVYGNLQDGSCVKRREADGCSCTSDEQCPQGLECVDATCTCSGRMVADGAYCLKPYELLLGAACGSGQHCLHRKEGSSEFVPSEAVCADALCRCRPGLVQDGWTCRRFRPGEYGCYSNADCSGDSVCMDRYCRCPSKHRVVIDGKCGRNDAATNVAEGRACDEILFKDRFCAQGLECVRCGENSNFRCRKYQSKRATATTCSGSAIINKQYTPLVTCSLLFIAMFYL